MEQIERSLDRERVRQIFRWIKFCFQGKLAVSRLWPHVCWELSEMLKKFKPPPERKYFRGCKCPRDGDWLNVSSYPFLQAHRWNQRTGLWEDIR